MQHTGQSSTNNLAGNARCAIETLVFRLSLEVSGRPRPTGPGNKTVSHLVIEHTN